MAKICLFLLAAPFRIATANHLLIQSSSFTLTFCFLPHSLHPRTFLSGLPLFLLPGGFIFNIMCPTYPLFFLCTRPNYLSLASLQPALLLCQSQSLHATSLLSPPCSHLSSSFPDSECTFALFFSLFFPTPPHWSPAPMAKVLPDAIPSIYRGLGLTLGVHWLVTSNVLFLCVWQTKLCMSA